MASVIWQDLPMTDGPLPWPYINKRGDSLIHVLNGTERCFTTGPIDSIKRGRSALIYFRARKNNSNTSSLIVENFSIIRLKFILTWKVDITY